MLTPGDVLYVGPDWYLVIEAAEEPVIAVLPRSREEAIRVAFEVGNRHFTLALDGDRLLVPDDTGNGAAPHAPRRYRGTERARSSSPSGAGHRHDH